ncbi:MAG: MBL fold metallo-hydrolase, partial [Ilumatobacteraceae bacterium]
MPADPEVTVLGAAGTVTGSCNLVESPEGGRVLVDVGLYQGRKELRLRNWAPFPFEPASIDAVVLTHAHVDHCGLLPKLVRDGFTGAVHATPNTARLARIVLPDSGHLHEEEAAFANRKGYSKHDPALPLYTEADAERSLQHLREVDFGAPTVVAPGIEVTFRHAGHILGAASPSIRFVGTGRRAVFSGDLGRDDHPLLVAPDP